MKRLGGLISIVTGSGVGIGKACAMRLADEGATVFVADLDLEGANQTAAEIRDAGGSAEALEVDIGEEQSIREAIARVAAHDARLDVLVNNAADTSAAQIAGDMAIDAMDTRIWDRAFQVNTRGTMLMTKHTLPLMRPRGGSIINMSSGTALRGDLFTPAYAASKAAINCLTTYIATQNGKDRIRCNAIAPGLVRTPKVVATNSAEQLSRVELHNLTPYLGEPEDIAAVVAFLASNDARYITGQVISVDGGVLTHLPYYAEIIGSYLASPTERNL